MSSKRFLTYDTAGNQQLVQPGDFLDIANGGTGATTQAGARTALGLTIGSAVQSWNAQLDAVSNLATVGSVHRTAANTIVTRTLEAPLAGITVTNGDGVAGNPTIGLANDLAALEALIGVGYAVRTAADTWAQRQITVGQRLTVVNADGVSGNTALDLATVPNAGGGTLQKFVQDAYGRVTGSSAVTTSDLTSMLNSTYLGLNGGTMLGTLTLAGDPVGPLEPATRQFVVGLANGQLGKPSVDVVCITNVNITNPGTAVFDTITLSPTGNIGNTPDRLLLVGQDSPAENGPWLFNGAGAALTRPADFLTSDQIVTGATYLVTNGAAGGYKKSVWSLITEGPFVLGTTALTFTQTNGLADVAAINGLTMTGNTISTVLAPRLTLTGNAIDLAASGATAGTGTKMTVDSYGRVTAVANATPADIGAQPAHNELTGLAALVANGFVARTANGSYAPRTLAGPVRGIAITNAGGVAGNPTFTLTNNLAAVESLLTNGIVVRAAGDVMTQVVITGSSSITVTNGDGVGGNPTLTVAPSGVAPGTYQSVTVGADGRVVAGTTIANIGTPCSQLQNSESTTVQICNVVYSDAVNTFKKAIANSMSTSLAVGLCFNDINAGAVGLVATSGEHVATTGQWDAVTGQTGGLTFGARYFIDTVTAGHITSTVPSSGFICPIGQALSATKMLVRVGERIQL